MAPSGREFRSLRTYCGTLPAVVVLGLLLGGVSLWFFDFGAKMAPGVSQEGLLELRPGMTEGDVLRLLGEPLSRERDAFLDTWSWNYGTPSPLTGGGPEMWVNFRNGRLDSAAVEYYDLGAFWCFKEQCPVIRDRAQFARLPAKRPT